MSEFRFSPARAVPGTVTVLGQRFGIGFVPQSEPFPRGVPDTAIGMTDLNRQYIRLRGSEEVGSDNIRDTVLHEVLHVIFHLFALNQREEGEDLIGVLASGLLDTLRRNPALVEYLMDGVFSDESETA